MALCVLTRELMTSTPLEQAFGAPKAGETTGEVVGWMMPKYALTASMDASAIMASIEEEEAPREDDDAPKACMVAFDVCMC